VNQEAYNSALEVSHSHLWSQTFVASMPGRAAASSRRASAPGARLHDVEVVGHDELLGSQAKGVIVG
jgi:hypothetical protein